MVPDFDLSGMRHVRGHRRAHAQDARGVACREELACPRAPAGRMPFLSAAHARSASRSSLRYVSPEHGSSMRNVRARHQRAAHLQGSTRWPLPSSRRQCAASPAAIGPT
eukprot:3697328-Rhodomonas_salina.1